MAVIVVEVAVIEYSVLAAEQIFKFFIRSLV